ncbi:MAG: helix-turn-helix domain containing protein [Desulfovibrio sp.]|jgi:transposase|nr:helix-turn-helix domain containing protein [Desulfovibrio sp.]
MIFALQDEIWRNDEARYDHRLHALLLVAQGMSCRQVARLLGDAPRTIAYWVNRFEDEGFAGESVYQWIDFWHKNPIKSIY